MALFLPLSHLTDVYGQQFITSTLAKRTGKCFLPLYKAINPSGTG